MKKFKKGVLAIGVLAAAAVIAAGCGKKDAKTTNETKKESAAESAVTEKKKLTYAKGTGPYTELFEQHVMPILEKQGYTFEATELTLQYADEAIAELEERVAGTVAERERVVQELTSQGWTIPDSQGNFVWIAVKKVKFF